MEARSVALGPVPLGDCEPKDLGLPEAAEYVVDCASIRRITTDDVDREGRDRPSWRGERARIHARAV
jgi:hypothetical protein